MTSDDFLRLLTTNRSAWRATAGRRDSRDNSRPSSCPPTRSITASRAALVPPSGDTASPSLPSTFASTTVRYGSTISHNNDTIVFAKNVYDGSLQFGSPSTYFLSFQALDGQNFELGYWLMALLLEAGPKWVKQAYLKVPPFPRRLLRVSAKIFAAPTSHTLRTSTMPSCTTCASRSVPQRPRGSSSSSACSGSCGRPLSPAPQRRSTSTRSWDCAGSWRACT